MKNKISIIIPTYNRKHLISKTIDNLLNQTLQAHEIIVVDDHSTDGTIEWLNKHYGNKIIVLKNRGKGPGTARNTGLKSSTGDYIKFFDSDDIMTLNTLEVQAEALDKTGKAYVTGPYFYASEKKGTWTPKDNVIINYNSFPQNKPLWHWMIWGLFIPIPGMMFRKELLLEAGPWPEDIITSEDWLYLWRIAITEPFPAHDNRCAFIYRLHGEQSVGNNFDNLQRDKEKYSVHKYIYDNYKTQLGFIEKQIFLNKFYQMSKFTDDISFKSELKKYSGILPELIWQLFRIKHKLGRIKTKTDWQPMHGVKRSIDIINTYLNNTL